MAAILSRGRWVKRYLVDIVLLQDPIKARIEVIQEVHDLQRCRGGAEGSEPHDVTEEYGDLGEGLGLNSPPLLQFVRHWTESKQGIEHHRSEKTNPPWAKKSTVYDPRT